MSPRLVPVTEDRGFTSPCHVWPGSVNHAGYGRAWGGQAHRVFWEREHGPVPESMELDHLCRQRDCVNPEHLEVVTHAENTRRAHLARAAGKPDPSGVRQLRVAHGLSQRQLADAVGCTQTLVSQWERSATRICEPYASRLSHLGETGEVVSS